MLAVAAAGHADTVTPGNAPSVRVLSYNVCGAYPACQYAGQPAAWLGVVEAQVVTWDADVLMLQELCFEQWSQLRSRLAARGYVGIWTSTMASAGGCAKWGGSADLRFGLGTFVRASAADRFAADLTVPSGQEGRAVLCARPATWTATGGPTCGPATAASLGHHGDR